MIITLSSLNSQSPPSVVVDEGDLEKKPIVIINQFPKKIRSQTPGF